jgi:hypothetical protein
MGKNLLFVNLLVLVTETFHAARGIDKFLLAGEKRMAVRTDFDLDIVDGRPRFYDISAGAGYCRLLVLGMNLRFHLVFYAFRRFAVTGSPSIREIT